MVEIVVGSSSFALRGRLTAPPNPWVVTLLLQEEPPAAMRALDESQGPISVKVDRHEVFRAVGQLLLVEQGDHWLAEVQLREPFEGSVAG